MHTLTRTRAAALAGAAVFMLVLGSATRAAAQEDGDPPGFPLDRGHALASLKTLPIPMPPDLGDFIADRATAIALGKALFWDMQVGSDGMTACATCHFHAGADSRSFNSVNPGANAGDTTFDTAGPGAQLLPGDFPLHRFADPSDAASELLFDSNDVVGSQGVLLTRFLRVSPGSAFEEGTPLPDPVFNVNGVNTRRVTGRNAPSAINAVFNYRNFWDGRAQNDFNGVNPFGSRDPDARVLTLDASGQVVKVRIDVKNASLASQAVGPPGSNVEMSYDGRIFRNIGAKLISGELPPLGRQLVDPTDGVLGPYANDPTQPARGLNTTYAKLIKKAFKPAWWGYEGHVDDSGAPVLVPDGRPQYLMMEYNFALIFGLAVQLYESTLVADDSRVDRYLEGDRNALSELEIWGMAVFRQKGSCANCHGGALLSNASVEIAGFEPTERMFMAGRGVALYDDGFYNIGVRPTSDDPGVGGNDPFGHPLSFAAMSTLGLFVDPRLRPPVSPGERLAVTGSFKVPGLRNVELTGPYFHNGGQATLRQVIEFYNRGGDFRSMNSLNLDPDIEFQRFSDRDMDGLEAFLKALTDERVRQQLPPFDHPQLFVPDCNGLREVPAVGAAGGLLDLNFLGERHLADGTVVSQVQCQQGPAASKDVVSSWTGLATEGTRFIPALNARKVMTLGPNDTPAAARLRFNLRRLRAGASTAGAASGR